jgi:hypothetical protein
MNYKLPKKGEKPAPKKEKPEATGPDVQLFNFGKKFTAEVF